MAARTSVLRFLTAALVSGFALSLASAPSAVADDDPGAKRKRVTYKGPRVMPPPRTVYVRVPTPVPVPVVQYVPVYTACGGSVAPAAYVPPPRYYYYNGCNTCGRQAVVPYSWAARYWWHRRHAHRHHHHHYHHHRY